MVIAAYATQQINDLVAIARKELARRPVRASALDSDYFGEPAWNMLLYLYVAARDERLRVFTKEITAAAHVPFTTALRWLDHLENVGEISRSPSDQDGRVTYVALSGVGMARVERALFAMLEAEQAAENRFMRMEAQRTSA